MTTHSAETLSTFRRGLKRGIGLFDLAFQGSAAETHRLDQAGLVKSEVIVKLPDGSLGRELTGEGERIARRMLS